MGPQFTSRRRASSALSGTTSASCLDGSSTRQRGTAALACTSRPRSNVSQRSLPTPRSHKTRCSLGPGSYSCSRGHRASICARFRASWSTRTRSCGTQSCATGRLRRSPESCRELTREQANADAEAIFTRLEQRAEAPADAAAATLAMQTLARLRSVSCRPASAFLDALVAPTQRLSDRDFCRTSLERVQQTYRNYYNARENVINIPEIEYSSLFHYHLWQTYSILQLQKHFNCIF